MLRILLFSLFVLTNAKLETHIAIKNNFRRTLYNPHLYFLKGGISSAFQKIQPDGEGDIFIDTRNFAKYQTTGLATFHTIGFSGARYVLSWIVDGKNNKIGFYYGNESNKTRLYAQIFNQSNSDPSYTIARDGGKGWFDVIFGDQSMVSVFMSTGSSPDIRLHFKEYNRKFAGAFYIQFANSNYSLVASPTYPNTVKNDYFDIGLAENINYLWNVTSTGDSKWEISPYNNTLQNWAYSSGVLSNGTTYKTIELHTNASRASGDIGLITFNISQSDNGLYKIKWFDYFLDGKVCLSIQGNLSYDCSPHSQYTLSTVEANTSDFSFIPYEPLDLVDL